MELSVARALAAEAFALRNWRETATQEQLEKDKKQRRKIADELRRLEKLWDGLSPEAYGLLSYTEREVLGLPDFDYGTIAAIAREQIQKQAGRRGPDRYRRAAEPLVAYWRATHGEPTRTLYKDGDASVLSPSPAVEWLGSELQRVDPGLSEGKALRIAFRALDHLTESNASYRSK